MIMNLHDEIRLLEAAIYAITHEMGSFDRVRSAKLHFRLAELYCYSILGGRKRAIKEYQRCIAYADSNIDGTASASSALFARYEGVTIAMMAKLELCKIYGSFSSRHQRSHGAYIAPGRISSIELILASWCITYLDIIDTWKRWRNVLSKIPISGRDWCLRQEELAGHQQSLVSELIAEWCPSGYLDTAVAVVGDSKGRHHINWYDETDALRVVLQSGKFVDYKDFTHIDDILMQACRLVNQGDCPNSRWVLGEIYSAKKDYLKSLQCHLQAVHKSSCPKERRLSEESLGKFIDSDIGNIVAADPRALLEPETRDWLLGRIGDSKVISPEVVYRVANTDQKMVLLDNFSQLYHASDQIPGSETGTKIGPEEKELYVIRLMDRCCTFANQTLLSDNLMKMTISYLPYGSLLATGVPPGLTEHQIRLINLTVENVRLKREVAALRSGIK
jgi:hypothetical protein